MKNATEIPAAGSGENVDYLRAGADQLRSIACDIGRLIDVSTMKPALQPERVAGQQDAHAVVMQLVDTVERRLDQLTAAARMRTPVVVDPMTAPLTRSAQGQLLFPIVSRPMVHTEGISSAEVWMPPGHAAHAHVHYDTDIIVLVRDGEAVTLWWDGQGVVHELQQRCGQHLHIPRGVPHAALNRGNRPVLASEFRSASCFQEDNHRLPDLEPIVRARLQVPLAAA